MRSLSGARPCLRPSITDIRKELSPTDGRTDGRWPKSSAAGRYVAVTWPATSPRPPQPSPSEPVRPSPRPGRPTDGPPASLVVAGLIESSVNDRPFTSRGNRVQIIAAIEHAIIAWLHLIQYIAQFDHELAISRASITGIRAVQCTDTSDSNFQKCKR